MRGHPFEDHDNLSELELALCGRAGPEPTPALHRRVMAGVQHALSEPSPARKARWLPAADLVGWAAVLIVGLALSQIASSTTGFFDRAASAAGAPPRAETVRATADLVRRACPGLSPDDAGRLALASACHGQLTPVPVADGSASSSLRAPGSNIDGDVR